MTKFAKTLDEAKHLFHNKNYVVIPILDEHRHIISFYHGEDDAKDIKCRESLNTPVVINAGGKGTRLDPFTRVLPKPLIPVGELPIIEHILREYQTFDCNSFNIIVNYKKDLIKAYFADNDSNYSIQWYDEDKPLGTGGGLSLLKGKISETFFFANCDVLIKTDYGEILEFHKQNHNTITMVCAHKNISIPYGVVEVGNNGEISEMREKPNVSFLTNTGMYIVEPDVLEDIDDDVSIGFPDIIEMERNKGKKVAVYPINEKDWMDMGQLDELDKMRLRLYGE
jgi:NDP-sugar pyrophosphorylase family protein